MPVFQETSDAARDLRILPSIVNPIPRLTEINNKHESSDEHYDVVVIGAGPAGLFLTLCLARYGLTDDDLLCLDAKPGTLKAGQADGLQPRTLEVLKSLGIVDEIMNNGCHMSEVAFWNPNDTGGIERTNFAPDVTVRARYRHEITIHQGRIERILEENLGLYSGRRVVRSSHFLGLNIDSVSDADYPVVVDFEQETPDGQRVKRTVRTKHLVGADGAHSKVRRAMDLKLEGETTDHIWGVADFVADTDFPDIRRRCAIHSSAGSIMIIPREQIRNGDYLTRLYVQVKDDEVAPDREVGLGAVKSSTSSREKRAAITLDYIMEQAQRVLSPYTIALKKNAVVDWWAAYQIGQRMAPAFSLKDNSGVDRVFIVGDACHTHSPKAGQGMNVSMMDSYNLSWKLVHTLHGLTPKSTKTNGDSVLATFGEERVSIARQLIEFDSKFSSMFSGQIEAANPEFSNLTHDAFLKVFSDGSGFTSGCGIEYGKSVLVDNSHVLSDGNPVVGQDYLNGNLMPGRRLANVKLKRYADSNIWNLQDDFPSTGRYRILVLTSSDLLSPNGSSATALQQICSRVIPAFPADMVELVVVHPIRTGRFEWKDLPACLKEYAEMRFHGFGEDETYSIYGVPEHQGAIVAVRPDGYVGVVSYLQEVEEVFQYLKGCLVVV